MTIDDKQDEENQHAIIRGLCDLLDKYPITQGRAMSLFANELAQVIQQQPARDRAAAFLLATDMVARSVALYDAIDAGTLTGDGSTVSADASPLGASNSGSPAGAVDDPNKFSVN